eukprot:TRINITY_DN18412_c0_g1_i1.p1 TRINITY_DN18412_c0_g1~~TRINITY_DN18412_c0_g1_i1.p1  ORF type:complete len:134 (-),score=15.10 TRINITY_DN18412_c0_g1_i1:303-704(-)
MVRKIKIGGSEHNGCCVWTQRNGKPANVKQDGWEMKFKVDDEGNVSGGNHNDTKGQEESKKHYTGSLSPDGKLEVTATFEGGKYDGQVNLYTGEISEDTFTGTVVLKSSGKSGAGCPGDRGTLTGGVKIKVKD